jgi:hypothetical protein
LFDSAHTIAGRMVNMAIILFSILYVPSVTGKILEVMQMESKYARMTFVAGSNSKHIIICGDLESISLRDFLDELFHEDHNNSEDMANILQIVILQPSKSSGYDVPMISYNSKSLFWSSDPPTAEMAALLMDPFYSLRLTYIEGSALNDKALERCSTHNASAVFVMANKFSTHADEQDAKTILHALSIRRFNDRKHNHSVPNALHHDHLLKYYLQVIKSENTRLMPANDLRNKSVVVCMNDIKMGLVAKATVYPGTNTFILNLITSIAHRGVEDNEVEEQKFQNELNQRALLLGHRRSIYTVAATSNAAAVLPVTKDEDSPGGKANCKNVQEDSKESNQAYPANQNDSNVSTGSNNNNNKDEAWLSEYSMGCDWEVYTVPLSPVFEGSKFVDTSFIVAQRTNILMIGLHVIDLTCGLSKVLLNPATFIIPKSFQTSSAGQGSPSASPGASPITVPAEDGEKLFEVSAIVMAKNKLSALQLSHLSEGDAIFYSNALRHSKTNARISGRSKGGDQAPTGGGSPPSARAVRSNRSTHRMTSVRSLLNGAHHKNRAISMIASMMMHTFESEANHSRVSEDVNNPNIRTSMVDMGQIAEQMDMVPENFIKLEMQALKQRTHVLDTPRSLQESIVPGSIIDWLPQLMNHIIITGKDLSNIYDLIRPLRAKYLGPVVKPIIVLHQYDISDVIWSRVSIFPEVYIIKGSSLHEVDLMRSGIFRAQQVVVLADACTHEMALQSNSATTTSQMEALVDSDALFTYQCVKRLVPHVHIVVEMFQQQNISYLEQSHMHLPTEEFRFSRPFASGSLFTTSMLDSLVCQTFYNPVHMKIVEKLISGVDAIDRDALLVDAITEEMGKLGVERKEVLDVKNSILNNVKESSLYLIESIPQQCHNKPYRVLFEVLAKTNVIPLGLLRSPNACASAKSHHQQQQQSQAPHVTNEGQDSSGMNPSSQNECLSDRVPSLMNPNAMSTPLNSSYSKGGSHANNSGSHRGSGNHNHKDGKSNQAVNIDHIDNPHSVFSALKQSTNAKPHHSFFSNSDAYVYTNPSRNTIVNEGDKVFVLSTVPFAPVKEVSRVS